MIRTLINMIILSGIVWFFVRGLPPFSLVPWWVSLGGFAVVGGVGAFLKPVTVYLMRCLNALSQLGNALLGPIFNVLLLTEARMRNIVPSRLARYGFPDESISSVTHKNAGKIWVMEPLRLALELVDPGHGHRAAEYDEGRTFHD